MLEGLFTLIFGNRKKLKAELKLKSNVKTIVGTTVNALLKRKFHNANIHTLYGKYSVPTYQDFENWLEVDKLNLKAYVKDKSDYDNLAVDSYCGVHNIVGNMSYGFAISSNPAHVFNVLITQDFDIRQIELQSDMVCDYPEEFVYLIII